MNNTDWSITLALIIYRKLETTNTDLQELIDVLGNIVPILEDNTTMQDNTEPESIEQEPILEDVGDLDFLLYENPKI